VVSEQLVHYPKKVSHFSHSRDIVFIQLPMPFFRVMCANSSRLSSNFNKASVNTSLQSCLRILIKVHSYCWCPTNSTGFFVHQYHSKKINRSRQCTAIFYFYKFNTWSLYECVTGLEHIIDKFESYQICETPMVLCGDFIIFCFYKVQKCWKTF
jgi:hypothetical protein